MVIVFDLDDTLYEELAFVRGGFKAVANFLGHKFNLQPQKLYKQMLVGIQGGRGRIFDDILRQNGFFSKKLVKKCISVYRQHKPEIRLYRDAERFFKKSNNCPVYIVTDGNKIVQKNKIAALGIGNKVKKVFITRQYGIKNEKPSPYCFSKICLLEKVAPKEIVFIGDNPHKDFVGIKSLGFKTIRVRRGNYACINLSKKYEADREIKNLTELII